MHHRLFAPRWLTNLLQVVGVLAQPYALLLWKMRGEEYAENSAWVSLAGLTAALLGYNWGFRGLGLLMRLASFAGYLAFASLPAAALTDQVGWLAMLPICTVIGLALLCVASDMELPGGNSLPLN